jgi:hypothetical protein
MSQNEIQIPRDYRSWKAMITGQCKETLSKEYIDSRLKALNNPNDPYTQKFAEVYGENYVRSVISWFEHAKNDMT